MTCRWVWLVAFAVTVLGVAADVEAAGQPDFNAIEGTCLRVELGGDDLTASCLATIGRSAYSDGRVGFYFMLTGSRILTFSGVDRSNRAQGFDIDRVVINAGAANGSPNVLAASGHCAVRNGPRGADTIQCSGQFSKGTRFSAAFRLKGKPKKGEVQSDN